MGRVHGERPPFLHSTHCSFNTVAMAGVRLQYRRRNPYNTTSNNVRVIKTPGGKLRLLHIKKRGTAPKCGDCGIKLPGVPALRPREYATTSRPQKTAMREPGMMRRDACLEFGRKWGLKVCTIEELVEYVQHEKGLANGVNGHH